MQNASVLPEVLLIVPNSETLSLLVWVLIAIVILYLARYPAHSAIMSIFNAFYSGFRMASRSFMIMAQRMSKRNREILIAAGHETAERKLEKEFLRMDTAVKRDLGNYPSLHREVQERMNQLEADYRSSTEEQPPNVDGWEKAIVAVAKIPSKSSTMVADVLGDINDSFNSNHQDVVKEYRKINKERHKILGRMIPTVRSLSVSMDEMNKNIKELTIRAKEVGKYMDEFSEMRSQSDKAESLAASTSLNQFLISGLILAIAIAGAVANFGLIKGAMSEMVGANEMAIGGIRTSVVASMVIIMIELSMGLFLMELLRITHLFPGIGSMDDSMRKKLAWLAFIILTTFACLEAALGILREVKATNREAVDAAITGTKLALSAIADSSFERKLNMVLSFVLPFALVFVAIPLEYFVQSSLIAMRTIWVALLRLIGFILRLIGNIFRHIGKILVHAYDLIIIVPLWLEYRLTSKEKRDAKGKVGMFS